MFGIVSKSCRHVCMSVMAGLNSRHFTLRHAYVYIYYLFTANGLSPGGSDYFTLLINLLREGYMRSM
jgi:hypothetical protein